jgi:hypothetical protein
MGTHDHTARALGRLADAIAAESGERARRALMLERDRTDAELAELRDEIAELGGRVLRLENALGALSDNAHHSVRTDHLKGVSR